MRASKFDRLIRMTNRIYQVASVERRPRVAIIYHFFAHYREAIVERLARSALVDFVFVGDDHDYESTVKRARFSDKVSFLWCPTKRLFRSLMWQQGIVNIALSKEFDQLIFLGNPYWIATWIAAIMGRISGKRVIFWSHGFLDPPTGLKGILRRLFYGLADAHLFYSRLAKRNAIATGWDPQCIYVVGNSLDLDVQAKERQSVTHEELVILRARLFRNPGLPIVFCSCRLLPSKRLDLLVMALDILRRNGVQANLLIVGDGPCRAELECAARHASVDAHFTGACYDNAQLARYLCASNVTVSPGAVGLTAIQSMTFGVPVITHGTMGKQGPEAEAVVPGVTGDFYELGNVLDLVRVMEIWLVRRRDRTATRAACIDIVERFWSPGVQQRVIEDAVLSYRPDDVALERVSDDVSNGE